MNDLSKWLPADLEGWIETRVADGVYFDAGDYLRDLVRRDREQVKDSAWVRAMVDEGLASGVIEAEPEQLIEDIIGELTAEDG